MTISPSAAVWPARRNRALRLAAELPHAAQILSTYATVTEVQEHVAAQVPVDRWLSVARTLEVAQSAGPLLQLDRLPLGELLPLFTSCLEQMVGVGTDVMREHAKRLLAATSSERRTLVARALCTAVAADEPGLAFHALVFLEAVVTPLGEAAAADLRADVEPSPPAEEGAVASRCRACGGPAIVATLRDHASAIGARALVCGLCGSEQRIRRLTCAHCGETDAERLLVHAAESVPHVRLDECRSCGRYLKTVDLRRRGDAVPVVEELATVELDLWAREQGLTKLHTNVFGL